MRDVFITYDGEDEGAARRLADALEARGWSVFRDHTIPPGKSWNEVVGAELAVASCQLVLWSANSTNNIWVLEEARHGLGRGILIAAYLDDVAPPAGFGAARSGGLIEWSGTSLKPECPLIARIAEQIGPPSAAADTTTKKPPAEPEPPRSPEAASAPRHARPARSPTRNAPATPSEPPPAKKPTREAPGSATAPVDPAPSRPAPTPREPAPPAARRRQSAGSSSPAPARPRPHPGPFQPPKPSRVNEPELVMVPAGTLRLGGDEHSAEVVRIVKSFAIGRYPVTFDEYDRFALETGRPPPSDRGWGRQRRPVIGVPWEDAVAYARWLSGGTGKRYRLPTDSEWRYVAGVGGRVYEWSGILQSAELAEDEWYWPRYGVMTHPVNALPPNDLGVYDLQGNVWEWVTTDGHDGRPGEALCLSLDHRLDGIGFRVVRELD